VAVEALQQGILINFQHFYVLSNYFRYSSFMVDVDKCLIFDRKMSSHISRLLISGYLFQLEA
jgi:hypothetical protein